MTEIVSRELLEKLAATAPRAETRTKTGSTKFDLAAFIAKHRIDAHPPVTWNGGDIRVVLKACVFDPSHVGSSAAILQFASGALDYSCLHNGCADKRWQDVRKKYEPDYRPGPDTAKHENQASKLVELLNEAGAEFFHDGDDTYASFGVNGHLETHAVLSKRFRRFASRHYYQRTGSVPSAENLTAALNVLSAQADVSGEDRRVYLRTAQLDNEVFIDLGDATWDVIQVTTKSWDIISSSECRVRFRRSKSTRSLPRPTSGGAIKELRPFVNLDATDEAGFILLVCFMVAVLFARGPYPILLVIAEKGAAKSTLLLVLRALLDPSDIAIRSLPKDSRDFAISCENSFMIAYDNVSRLLQWISDIMCTAATGGAFGVRTNYENREEEVFKYLRPLMMATIKEVGSSPDFQDRAIKVFPPKIDPKDRRDEKIFWAEFQKAAPRILGALLNGVSHALRNIDSVTVEHLPRMADFTKCAVAAVSAFDWDARKFLDAYRDNVADADAAALEGSLIAPLLPTLVLPWTGTATELLEALALADPEIVKRKFWPADGRALANQLRTIMGNLRSTGIDIKFKRSNGKREITISACGVQATDSEGAFN